jgi:hypothetical protein
MCYVASGWSIAGITARAKNHRSVLPGHPWLRAGVPDCAALQPVLALQSDVGGR